MQPGDTVLITSESDDQGSTGTLRYKDSVFLRVLREFWVVVFADGHEGAYEEWELRVVEA